MDTGTGLFFLLGLPALLGLCAGGMVKDWTKNKGAAAIVGVIVFFGLVFVFYPFVTA